MIDSKQLKIVLSNFISNAIKFTPAIHPSTPPLSVLRANSLGSSSSSATASSAPLPSSNQSMNNRVVLLVEEREKEGVIGSAWTRLVFTVKDPGIGMSNEEIEKLMMPSPHLNRTGPDYQLKIRSPTGLGVLICQQIVKMMGGAMSVESEGRGKGTTIRFDVFCERVRDYNSHEGFFLRSNC